MAVLLGMSLNSAAQPPRMMLQQDYKSTIINPDGTVTFQYRNDRAKEVSVDVQFAGRKAMVKDANTGLWSVTLGPASPDMYPYCFIVDGVSIMDSKCEQYFPNEGFKNSLLEIPSTTSSLPHDIKNVPHGTMEYIHYYSNSVGVTNNAIVYLPPQYHKDTEKKYPVFYLISGTTDTEEVYYKVGRVNYILDNLLAEGLAKEMIVVLPYGNPNKLLLTPPSAGMPVTGFGGDVFSNDLINDLMPYVESHYRTLNDRDNRAIGGFSRGGNQGLSNGLRNLDKFSYLCSYSSFTSTDIPDVYDKAKDTNKKIHLFWTGVGTDDFLYGNARDYTEFLDKKGIRSVKEYTTDKFGHTWMNAKYFLDKTLRLLFNPEASAMAMKNAKRTMPKIGNEQQFTPGVMARLFPKAIISPEYVGNDVIFRFNAPNAKNVSLESDIIHSPISMSKDNDGVWSITCSDLADKVFKYCFVVDGVKVADPGNMYLSPDKGFKYSISYAPKSGYYLPAMSKMEHGSIRYDYANSTALYVHPQATASSPVITLIPGADDTAESWFKIAHANAIVDKLVSEGKCKPCSLVVASEPVPNSKVIRASNSRSWNERAKALENYLLGKNDIPFFESKPYEGMIDSKAVSLYTISDGRVGAQISNYGGFIVSLFSLDAEGNYTNLVTGYNELSQYTKYNLGQVGPALGRYANRIGGAKFKIKGKEYNLTKNNGENILHGGVKGFDHVVWDVVSHDANSLVLQCILPDGADGFPGNLTTTLTYSIADDGLTIHYEATTDKPTVVNLSNHAYFNLNGTQQGDIMDHILTINADKITEASRDGIPTGKFLPVDGTVYDFRSGCRIGDRQMSMQGFRFGQRMEIPEGKVMNYDNNFCLKHRAKTVECVATLYSPQSGRVLEVWNDHPGLQVYTGARKAIALESQMYPDSPNHPEFPSTLLRKGETYKHTCIYKLSVKK